MDILGFGMKMELDGKAFYEEHASKISDRNAADILQCAFETSGGKTPGEGR